MPQWETCNVVKKGFHKRLELKKAKNKNCKIILKKACHTDTRTCNNWSSKPRDSPPAQPKNLLSKSSDSAILIPIPYPLHLFPPLPTTACLYSSIHPVTRRVLDIWMVLVWSCKPIAESLSLSLSALPWFSQSRLSTCRPLDQAQA